MVVKWKKRCNLKILRDHEEEQWLPDELYRFIEIIQDDLRHH